MKRQKKEKLIITGMTCVNCSAGIKKYLQKKGLRNVKIDFATGNTSYDRNMSINKNEVCQMITQLGYNVNRNKVYHNIPKVEKYFYFTLIFTIPLFAHMFMQEHNILHNPLVQFILCVPVYIIGVLYFGKSAWNSLKTRIPNMDVLIFIGSSSAFIYSISGWLLFLGTDEVSNYLFFETTATIITLVLLGNVLEHRSVNKTTTAIEDLSEIQKVVAKKETNGRIEEVNFEQIQKGDVLIMNNGDKIPTDGIVLSGECFIDESMITGESNLVNKLLDSVVIGGTIVTEGSIKIRATKVGDDTLLSQIIELVRNSQENKPDIQKIGDKVSSIFVPVVLLISLLTFIIGHYYFNILFQEALLRAIAVLVISCPCAMGLATPTAVMVGIGRAAKNGILIKGGQTLEKLANIKNLVFDKTGTLTTGEFVVSKLNVISGSEDQIKDIIYNLEKHSSHPIAKSLCKAFREYNTNIDMTDIKEVKGLSVSANINSDSYTIGSSRIIDSILSYDLFLLKNKKLIAALNIVDKLKEGTKDIIQKLQKEHYDITLLSGDKKDKCLSIGSELDISSIYSEQLPTDKINKITGLVASAPTAMIGDGINDAPALAKATVGISIANATQIAIKSSEIILLNKEDLNQLPQVLKIGKHTLKTIKQNLFWAFAYNLVAIPIAISGLLNPMWGALFMAFSDVVVIGNSIRLRYKKIF